MTMLALVLVLLLTGFAAPTQQLRRGDAEVITATKTFRRGL
jgi:hypothetical protein